MKHMDKLRLERAFTEAPPELHDCVEEAFERGAKKMKRSERKQAKQELREATQTILGDIIVGLRKKADLSQEDLAYESGVDRSFMSKIETGQTAVSLLTLMRLGKTLGAKTSDIIIELEKKMEQQKQNMSDEE